jgi:predicted phosphodiesterase
VRDVGRTIILSDTHLGRPRDTAGTPEELRPLWSGANRLIINGDVAELTDPRYRARAARMVCRLQDLCDADGVELIMLSGNHDPLLTDVRELDLAGGRVHLTHGDVLHPSISPWTTHADELAYWNRRALSMLGRRTRQKSSARLAAAQFAAARVAAAEGAATGEAADVLDDGRSRRARTVARGRALALALWSWQTTPRRAAAYLLEHRPQARFFVFGHLHRAGVWEFDGRVLINTGAYGAPVRPRAVVLEDGEVRVHPVILAAHGHSLSARPSTAYPLGQLIEPPVAGRVTPPPRDRRRAA